MDKQIKLLNKDYLNIRLGEIKEIRKKEIAFKIEESDRAFSKSIYICFYTKSSGGQFFKTSTLRISDHLLENCPHTQFIIKPDDFLSKKKKEQFMKAINLVVQKSKKRSLFKEIEKISREFEDEQRTDI